MINIIIKRLYSKKIFEIIIILQPIIDIITYFFKINNFALSIGILFRTLMLIYACTYLIFVDKNKKQNSIFFIFGAAFFLINIVFNYTRLLNYAFSIEINQIAKVVFFPIILLLFYRYNNNNKVGKNKLDLSVISYSGIIIGLCMLFANIIGYSKNCTYGVDSFCINGTSGFFYSANELGVVLCFILLISVYNYVSHVKSKKYFVDLLSILLSIYSILILGTKASFLGLILILIFIILFIFVKSFINKEKKHVKFLSVLLLSVLFIYTAIPKLAVCSNNNSLFEYIGISCYQMTATNKKTQETVKTDKLDKISNTENLEKLISNGRGDYKDYIVSNVKTKKNKDVYLKFGKIIVGLGLQKIDNNIKLIEMDFYDLYYSYGIIGAIYILLIPIILVFKYIMYLLKNFSKIFESNILLCFGCIIALGIAYIAGHVLLSPAVSFYLAICFVYGFADYERKNIDENKK